LVDSVSGDLPGKIFNVMPDSSKMIVYGALSGQGLENVDPRELIFKGKKIVGFILGEWLANLETSKMMEITSEIQNLFASKQLETKINKIISLDEISEGILTYANNMTKGKVVLMP
jgi:NADPH:quinone reductase-like Zn-dependent oxidoreductase